MRETREIDQFVRRGTDLALCMRIPRCILELHTAHRTSFHARHGPHRHTIRALAPARGGTSSWHMGWVQMHRVRTDARRGGSWGGSRLTDDGPHALVRSASGGSGSERGLRVRDLRSEISVTTDHVT